VEPRAIRVAGEYYDKERMILFLQDSSPSTCSSRAP
jgi:hypothetical protein